MNMQDQLDSRRSEAREHAATLVREARARLGLTQEAFAGQHGVAQSLLSKYERGLVPPPADLLVHCMEIVRPAEAVSEDELIRLVRARLRGKEMNPVRVALANVITCISPRQKD